MRATWHGVVSAESDDTVVVVAFRRGVVIG